jgi:hypothetical protein
MFEPRHNRHPGDAEAAGAIAALAETFGRQPWKPGDRVRMELPFVGRYGTGTVVEVNSARVVVDVDGDLLWYYPHELQRVEG